MVRACPTCGSKNRLKPARLHQEARCGRCQSPISPLDAPLPVESAADFDALVGESSLPVVVDFWAAWCGPCKMMAPELDRLAKETRGEILVAKVDTDRLPDVAGRFGIQSIPTLVLFRGGREARRAMGAMSAVRLREQLGV